MMHAKNYTNRPMSDGAIQKIKVASFLEHGAGQASMDMDISMDIHAKCVDMDMDMDGKFHIHGNPATTVGALNVNSVNKLKR